MPKGPEEKDWKTFRAMVPELRERYLRDQNARLTAIFEGEDATPTKTFWEAHERMEKIADTLRNCLDGHKRSRLTEFVVRMVRNRMMSDRDLQAFSEDFRARVRQSLELR